MSIPAFAVIGHPNEGKSSVVSTLTENERVRVSDVPGETTRTQRFAIEIDGRTVLEIYDTPGFQNPAAMLAWFQAWSGPEEEMVGAFIAAHRHDPAFHHDRELLEPLRQRAGILYVADPTRPLREDDRREMELLRLTGLPRIALLNAKAADTTHLPVWREALNRRFNLVREFNAHHASFAERLALLETLALLTPEWENSLRAVRDYLRKDWEDRLHAATLGVEALLARAIAHHVRTRLKADRDEAAQAAALLDLYLSDIRGFEESARAEWRCLYRHEALPDGLDELILTDLFAKRVWRLLGLSRRQIAMLGAAAGAAIGAGAEVSLAGLTFGVLTLAGAVAGGLSGWFGAPPLGARRMPLPGHRTLAREEMRVGPCFDPQLVFILLDRSLPYLRRLMNWSHARRDHASFLASLQGATAGSRDWDAEDREIVLRWLRARTPHPRGDPAETSRDLQALLRKRLFPASTA